MYCDRNSLHRILGVQPLMLLVLVPIVPIVPSTFAQDAEANGTYAPVTEFRRPDFIFDTINNESRSADSWDGQVVLLDFWATWCAPCIREMPIFDELRAEYHEQGFEVVGLAADERDRVADFLDRVPIEFPVLYGNIFEVMDLSTAYGNESQLLPFSALIDRNGDVRFIQKPGEIVREDLERALKELL